MRVNQSLCVSKSSRADERSSARGIGGWRGRAVRGARCEPRARAAEARAFRANSTMPMRGARRGVLTGGRRMRPDGGLLPGMGGRRSTGGSRPPYGAALWGHLMGAPYRAAVWGSRIGLSHGVAAWGCFLAPPLWTLSCGVADFPSVIARAAPRRRSDACAGERARPWAGTRLACFARTFSPPRLPARARASRRPRRAWPRDATRTRARIRQPARRRSRAARRPSNPSSCRLFRSGFRAC